jgi:hypothetical protein
MDFAHSERSRSLAGTLIRFTRDELDPVESIVANELTGIGRPHRGVAARNSSLEGKA